MSLRINGFDVAVAPTIPLDDPAVGKYDKFNPSTRVIEKGWRQSPEVAAFQADTIFEKDVAITLRDGVKIYVDIFRPSGEEKVPAIVMWSPYGKSGNGPNSLDMLPGRFGVPKDRVSGFEKFEGLDPAEWVARGYAIVNVDLRGSWDSEGIVPWQGEQDGKDGYDAIEYLAQLPWCTGKVATAGNSWLAMCQWFIAAQQPPHLAAIAPWEGAADFYRDTLARGGIPYPYDTMWGFLQNTTIGRNGVEAVTTMLEKYPLYNDYWDDKRAKLDKITTPAYVLASYSSALHTTGSIRGFNEIQSKDKWLRIHPRQEWSDLYKKENSDELSQFFAYYLKGIKNDFPKTPRVRVSLLGFNNDYVENVVVSDYPIPEAKYTKFYLGANGTLSSEPAKETGTVSYDGSYFPKQDDNDSEEVLFSHKFTKPTWLAGYSWIVLHVSNATEDDSDVFVQVRKLDKNGKLVQNLNVPLKDLIPPFNDASEVHNSCFLKYLGAPGSLRASHAVTKIRNSDPRLGDWPQYDHTRREPIAPGTVTRLEVPIWPTGITFEEGESLVVKISGHYMGFMEFEFLAGKSHHNKGVQTLHFGGEYDSYLVVPLMDPINQEATGARGLTQGSM
ncbi:hypothetical protein LTR10_022444 [Elasticomyces elasticus]|uniref:Xaa-Pro dipeptidyl-peptidase C-terminal domain-containing protein n=1 Tax=Exophiala sideris TaxID=1016849 RepID=A0ABR0J2I3_9EURO|nr:hypothetical protein LTR10_022444 [Elasticomyces elasticus]KAK5024880.1 hypothetical protein LTS07_008258 [Exophiala sideris]KAK5031530.1 hypothetical protein LTR13_007858 [Exophiala sideris]KAK5054919.1 hypothetical protein LTR69_008487 [Exophiala sideris]KAK5179798.1 hypothetical protein LTR44_007614 [Eurotiomycetes sp. CCFEE 6388]